MKDIFDWGGREGWRDTLSLFTTYFQGARRQAGVGVGAAQVSGQGSGPLNRAGG